MFTGIVEEMGKTAQINIGHTSGTIMINADKVIKDTKVGDSIAVNGVCLTVTRLYEDGFEADVMAETYRRSSLSEVKTGSRVNLERAMSANGRFGGHIVSGHIDGTGNIIDITPEENAVWYTIKASKNILNFIVEKGSIAIDGISLTVAFVDDSCFMVSIIPHTIKETVLQYRSVGDIVNLENDIIGKYVQKFMCNGNETIMKSDLEGNSKCCSKDEDQDITMEFLAQNGF